MKLTVLFVLAAFLQAEARLSAQQINLHVKNEKIEKVFKEIQKQSGYVIVYNSKFAEKANPVTINANQSDLPEVLRQCFENQPFTYEVQDKIIVVKDKPATAPVKNAAADMPSPIDVHGIVKDDAGKPAAGVSVRVKGTNKGTTTNDDGEFMLIGVDPKAILVFSSVNLETYETKLNGRNDVTLVMKAKVSQLEDVAVQVNTGYQKIPKERSTGSFDLIDNATLNQQVGTNILERLNGVASGVMFQTQHLQSGPSIIVRGLSTINGLKDPLIIVDNFPYDGDINNLNPNDVDNITVLKDAAAASIWGARAGNGVIVITTKKGRFNQPFRIGFNWGVISTKKPDLKRLRAISTNDFIDIEENLFNKGIYNSYDDRGAQIRVYPAFTPVIETRLAQRRGNITSAQADAQINEYRQIDSRDQYLNNMYENALTQQYSVNLQGGNDKFTYYFSAGDDRIVSTLHAVSTRYSFRFDNTFKPTKNLLVNLNVNYSSTDNSSGKSAFGTTQIGGTEQIPYLQLVDKYGNPNAVARDLRKTYTDTAGGGHLLDWNYYPLTDWKYTQVTGILQDLTANIGIHYKMPLGLSVDFKYLYEHQQNNTSILYDLQSYYARNLINTGTQINFSTGVVTYNVPYGDIYSPGFSEVKSQDGRGQINFNRSFGRSQIDAIVGGEIRENENPSISNTVYGYNPTTLVSSPISYNVTYPSYVNGNAQVISYPVSIQSTTNRFVSLFGNAAYTYNAKYTFSASARKDGSNLFGVTTNNKWNPLWSIGGSWLISKEGFYKSGALPYLKLRATYGFSGNTDPSRAAVTTIFNTSGNSPNYIPFAYIRNFPNPSLRWEKNQMINLAADFQIAKEVVSGTIEFYTKKGTDLYGPVLVDPTNGLAHSQSITENVANMKGNGWDITVNSNILKTGFKWESTLQFSYYSDKISKYYRDTTRKTYFIAQPFPTINPIEGQPVYVLLAYKWAGLDKQGNPQGYVNGQISENYNQMVNGSKLQDLKAFNAVPKFFGNFINRFAFKGFGLEVNISYRIGYYFQKPSVNYSSLYGGVGENGSIIGTSDYVKRWQKAGDENITNVPSVDYPLVPNRDVFYLNSEANIDRGDNIRLQYINLHYDFNQLKIGSLHLQQLQFYVNASNLGVLWKANKDGIDPDYSYSVPDHGKIYSVGIHANF